MTYTVPQSVQTVAKDALAAHRKAPSIDGVVGISVAEALASGEVGPDIVSRMCKFFTVASTERLEHVQQCKTTETSHVLRSWGLFGGDIGKRWAEKTYKQGVAENQIDADPVTGLFKLMPDQVYERFAIGAWRYEYGLDPRTAAQFVCEYARARRLPLDLRRAFGPAAEAVGNAVYRRFHTPNPFKAVYRAMLSEDAGTRLAAQVDLNDLLASAGVGTLDEALSKTTWTTMPILAASKVMWPVLIAHVILAVESITSMDALFSVNGWKKHPQPGISPLTFQYYSDAQNIAIAFFHPQGTQYQSDVGTKWEGANAAMTNMMWKISMGKPVPKTVAIKVLNQARTYIASRKLHGGLFSLLINAWKKGDYEYIHSKLPDDCDIKVSFALALNIPTGPVSAATIGNKPAPQDSLKAKLAAFLDASSYPVMSLEKTQTFAVAKDKGHVLTQGTVIREAASGDVFTVLGCIFTPIKFLVVVAGGETETRVDSEIADGLKTGFYTIEGVQASTEPEVDYPNAAKDAAEKALKDFIGTTEVQPHKLRETKTYEAANAKGWKWAPGVQFERLTSPDGKYTLLGAVVGTLVYIVAKRHDNQGIVSFADDEMAKDIKNGNVQLIVTALPVKMDKIKDWTFEVLTAFQDQMMKEIKAVSALSSYHNWVPDTLQGSDVQKVAKKAGYSLVEGIHIVVQHDSSVWVTLGLIKPPKATKKSSRYIIHRNIATGQIVCTESKKFEDQIGTGVTTLSMVTMPPKAQMTGTPPSSAGGAQPFPDDAKTFSFDVIAKAKKAVETQIDEETTVQTDFDAFKSSTVASAKWNKKVQAGSVIKTHAGATMEVIAGLKTDDGDKWLAYKQGSKFSGVDDDTLAELFTNGLASLDGAPMELTPFGYFSTLHDDADAAVEIELPLTDASDALEEHHDKSLAPNIVLQSAKGIPYIFLTAYVLDGITYIIYRDEDGDYYEIKDDVLTSYIGKGAITPGSPSQTGSLKKFALNEPPAPPPPVPAQPVIPAFTVNTSTPPKWAEGDVLVLGNAPVAMYVVRASASQYVVSMLRAPNYELKGVPKSKLEGPDIVLKAKTQGKISELLPLIALVGWSEIPVPEGKPAVGEPLMAGPVQYTVAKYAEDETGSKYAVLLRLGIGEFASVPVVYPEVTHLTLGSVQAMVKPSYALPPDYRPEPSMDDASEVELTKEGFPKLNYALSRKAKKLAGEYGFIYVKSPMGAPFHVGTKITDVMDKSWRVQGWIQTQGNDSKVLAAVTPLLDEDGSLYHQLMDLQTLGACSPYYEFTNLIAPSGETTISKSAGSAPVTVYAPVLGMFPNDKHKESEEPIKQPPFSMDLKPHQHISAGTVVIFPPGTTAGSGSFNLAQHQCLSTLTSVNNHGNMLVMLTHPMNAFGGYALTWPKGTVEPGESVEKAAIRETWEETGIWAKNTAHLGDYEGNVSVTRMFIGFPVSGDFKKAGKETDSVTLKPVPWLNGPDGMQNALDTVSKSAWYKQLKERDQKILKDAVAWVYKNGMPSDNPVQTADSFTQATLPTDVKSHKEQTQDAPNPVSGFGPGKTYTLLSAGPGWLDSTVDYTTSPAILKQTKSKFKGGAATHTWVPAWPLVQNEYPPPGAMFAFKGTGEQGTCVGYVERSVDTTGGPSLKRFIVWLEAEDGLTLTLIGQKLPKGKWETVTVPTTFAPVAKGYDAELVTLPAAASLYDMLKSLFTTSPFPITQDLLQAMYKSILATGAAKPESAIVSKTAPGGPPYLSMFIPAKGKAPHMCRGYIRLIFGAGSPVNNLFFIVATDAFGKWVTTQVTDETLTQLVVIQEPPKEEPGAAVYFTHPKVQINALIQAVGRGHKKVLDVCPSFSTFQKWCAEANVPKSGGITLAVAPEVAAMFVPGLIEPTVAKDILAMLAANASYTVQQLLKAAASAATTPAAVAPSQAPPVAPKITPATVAPKITPATVVVVQPLSSPLYASVAAAPNPALFKASDETAPTGGTNKIISLAGPAGTLWLGKIPKDGEPVRAAAEASAFKMAQAVGINDLLPCGEMEWNGKHISIQPYVKDTEAVPGNPGDLDDKQKVAVLRQHALDMFMGDHDGHSGNWLRKDGRLIPVDRGQAWKFYLFGNETSLDPSWNPSGNVGQVYAKRLLKDWGSEKTEIPDAAFAAMRSVIDTVQKLTDAKIKAILAPVLEAAHASSSLPKITDAAVLKRIFVARDAYLKNWEKILKKLRPTFVWPAEKYKLAGAMIRTPEDMKFGAKESQVIAEAATASWQGKSMSVDRDVIENQEVMVRRVMWTTSAGTVPATFIHFRLSLEGGLRGMSNALPKAQVSLGHGGVSTQGQLKIDNAKQYWPALLAALKTVNYHLHNQYQVEDHKNAPVPPVDSPLYKYASQGGPPAKVNWDSLNKVFNVVRPDLEQLVQETQGKKGDYAPTNEPNAAVHSMAVEYLGVISLLETWMTDAYNYVGKPTPQYKQFVWIPDEDAEKDTDKSKEPSSLPYQVFAKDANANWPNFPSVVSGGPVSADKVVHITDLDRAVYSSASQGQLKLHDQAHEAYVFIMPPAGTQLGSGVVAHRGQSWGIMAGEPSTTTVAHLLGLVEDAMGLELKPSTPKDREVLFLSKQAAVLQGGGKAMPKGDHTIEVEPEYAKAMKAYRQGDTDGAASALRTIVAAKLGVKPGKLEDLPGWNPEGEYDARGAGFNRVMRLGWTREKLVKTLAGSKGVIYVGHNPCAGGQDILKFWERVLRNGALIANSLKPYYGVDPLAGGASPGSDFQYGGTQGLFTCLRRSADADNHLYFDISLALRTDVYIVGSGSSGWDSFGRTSAQRWMDPSTWPDAISQSGGSWTGAMGAASRPQLNVRHDIDLRKYLVRCHVSGKTRDKIREMCKQAGWTTFANGLTLEEVIR